MTTRINPALCRLVMAQPWYDDDRIPAHMVSGAGERLPALLSRGVRAEVLYQMRYYFFDDDDENDHLADDWICDALKSGSELDFMEVLRVLRWHWESTP
jgi:hypothetical protein